MNESGPIKRPIKTQPGEPFLGEELVQLAPHIWRVTWEGKYWLLKGARSSEAASYVLLRREYEISRNLQHPFILNSFLLVEDSPVGAAILMEYVEGRTLKDFILERPSSSLRFKVLSQLLDAMEYLHHKGLLHNDLKAENILITAVGNDVKIIDFGLADSDADYLNRNLGGTPGWTAPEILQGEVLPPSASSDIYSIGGIISMLFPRRFRSIVRKCRQEVPSRRYQDIKSLRRAILVRRRFPVVMTLVVLGFALLALTMPVWLQEKRQQEEIERNQAAIRQIQSDLNVFYRAAADSLADRSAVPDQLKAYWVRNTFVEKTVQYKQTLQEPELCFVCDTVYARMVTSLSEMMLDIPQ